MTQLFYYCYSTCVRIHNDQIFRWFFAERIKKELPDIEIRGRKGVANHDETLAGRELTERLFPDIGKHSVLVELFFVQYGRDYERLY